VKATRWLYGLARRARCAFGVAVGHARVVVFEFGELQVSYKFLVYIWYQGHCERGHIPAQITNVGLD